MSGGGSELSLYNPSILSRDDLVAQFVVRTRLFERLVDDLGRGDPRDGAQHHLIVGQRGMGKTMLLRRLRFGVEEDPELRARWIPLSFPEEQYNVARLSDLWVNCLDALADASARPGDADDAVDPARLDAAIEALPDDEERRARAALELLLGLAAESGRGLVLLVDNLDLVLERLEEQHWAIREVLSRERGLVLIGASSAPIEATYTYEGAFYDFFHVHELAGLDEHEARTLLLELARLRGADRVARIVREDPGRIAALNTLTGGNPRTLVLLFQILVDHPASDVRSDLERLLDLCTPLYKARFESLPAQLQQLVDTLALHWDPMTAAELAAHRSIRMEVNNVSAQLNRLRKLGVVERVALPRGSKSGFLVAERFFNIWYLMRASRRLRRRLVWLVEFLRLFYGSSELRRRARDLLSEREAGLAADERGAEMALALSQSVEDSALSRALETAGIQLLNDTRDRLRGDLSELFDLEGTDAALAPIVDRMQTLRAIRAAIERDFAGWSSAKRAAWTADLLGSPSLFLEEKAAVAEGLARLKAGARNAVLASIRAEHERGVRLHGAAWERLREAFERGLVADATDDVDLESAAAALSAPEIVDVGRAIAAGLSERPGRWQAVIGLLGGGARSLASAELVEAAREWLRASLERPEWPFVWRRLLADRRVGERAEVRGELLALACRWVAGHGDHPAWGSVWDELAPRRRDLRGDCTSAEVLRVGWRWLAGREERLDWSSVWQRLVEARADLPAEIAVPKLLELGWRRLAGREDWNAWPHVWRSLVAVRADLPDGCTAGELLAMGRRWLDTHRQGRDLVWRGVALLELERSEPDGLLERRLATGGAGPSDVGLHDVLHVLRGAVELGLARRAAELVERCGQAERMRPVHEALQVVADGSTDRLLRLAPEVRRATEQVLDELLPNWRPRAPRSGPARSGRGRAVDREMDRGPAGRPP